MAEATDADIDKMMALLGPACCDCMSLQRIKSLAAAFAERGSAMWKAGQQDFRDGVLRDAENHGIPALVISTDYIRARKISKPLPREATHE